MNLGATMIGVYGLGGALGDEVGEFMVSGMEVNDEMDVLIKDLLLEGPIDVAFRFMWGEDTDFANRMGPKLFDGLLIDLFKADDSALESLFGAGGSKIYKISTGVVGAIDTFVRSVSVPEHGTVDATLDFMEDMKDITIDSISGWKNIDKAIYAWNHKVYLDSTGSDPVIGDITRFESILIGLGIKPERFQKHYASLNDSKVMADSIKRGIEQGKDVWRKYNDGEMDIEEATRRTQVIGSRFIGNPLAQSKVLTGAFKSVVGNNRDNQLARLALGGLFGEEAKEHRLREQLYN